MNKGNVAGRVKKKIASGNENSSNFDASHYKVFSACKHTHAHINTNMYKVNNSILYEIAFIFLYYTFISCCYCSSDSNHEYRKRCKMEGRKKDEERNKTKQKMHDIVSD